MVSNKSEADADSTKLSIPTGLLTIFLLVLAHADSKALSFITGDEQAHS